MEHLCFDDFPRKFVCSLIPFFLVSFQQEVGKLVAVIGDEVSLLCNTASVKGNDTFGQLPLSPLVLG